MRHNHPKAVTSPSNSNSTIIMLLRCCTQLRPTAPYIVTIIVIGTIVLLTSDLLLPRSQQSNDVIPAHLPSAPLGLSGPMNPGNQTQMNGQIGRNITENIASSLPSSCGIDTYPEWAESVIRDELGDRLLGAIYDPEYLVEASISSAAKQGSHNVHNNGNIFDKDNKKGANVDGDAVNGNLHDINRNTAGNHIFPIELGYEWSMSKWHEAPTVPSLMRTVPDKLLMLKRCMSLGLGRMVQDGRLAEDYRKIQMASASPPEGPSSPPCGSSDAHRKTSLKLLARSVRAVARAYGSYAVTFLQLIVDGEKGSGPMRELQKWVANMGSVRERRGRVDGKVGKGAYHDDDDDEYSPDPLLNIMGLLRIGNKRKESGTSSRKIRELLENIPEKGKSNGNIHGSSSETRTDNPALRSIEKEAEIIWENRLHVLNALLSHRDFVDARSEDTVSKSPIPRTTPTRKGSSNVPGTHMRYSTRAQYAVQYITNSQYGSHGWILNGRFWNSIRPVLGCSSLSKLCEEPDGCRYFCNLNYLLGADDIKQTSAFLPPMVIHQATSSTSPADDAQSSGIWRPYYHQMIGFGSNNEYDWEVGLVEAFDRGQPRANRIGKMTIFDCTVKKWNPPVKLIGESTTASDKGTSPSKNTVIDFGHAGFCIGPSDRPLSDGSVAAAGAPQQKGEVGLASLTFASLKKVLTNKDPSLARALRFDIKRYNSHPVNRDDSSRGGSTNDGGGVDRHGGVNYGLFDEVSIFKMDVEGYEHVTFPSWVAAELEDIGDGLLHDTSSSDAAPPSAKTVLFFDKVASNMFTISHLGMEFHRAGHYTAAGATYTGALRAHYSLMHLYALGFVMFAQEKNPGDYCCYELGFVHYRHYARSEGWQVVIA